MKINFKYGYKPFDIEYYQNGGTQPPTMGEKWIDEVLIMEPFERRLEKFRVSNNIPTFDEYYSERNKKAQQNRGGVSKEQLRTEYDRMLNTRYANKLMQEFPQQKNEHRGKYLDRLEKLGNGLSEYIGQWGVPLSRYDRIAQGVTGLADVVTGGAFNLYEKDNQNNFRLSEREKAEKRQALKENPWTERLSDGLSTLEIGSAPVEAVSSFIDPNVSFSQALAGQDTDVNGALKGLIGVGLGVGVNKSVNNAYRVPRRIKDELDEIKWYKNAPNYRYDFRYVDKLDDWEPYKKPDADFIWKLDSWLKNRGENIRYKRMYENPKSHVKLNEINKASDDYYKNEEYIKWLQDKINNKGENYGVYEDILQRINNNEHHVQLLTPHQKRLNRYLFGKDDPFRKVDAGIAYERNGRYGHVYGHGKTQNRAFIDLNKLRKQSDELKTSVGIHEGDHTLRDMNSLNKDFIDFANLQHDRFKMFEPRLYDKLKVDYYGDVMEMSARLSEMKYGLGKLPHESLSVEDIEKGLKYLESIGSKTDADVLRKVYGIEKLSELSKHHH